LTRNKQSTADSPTLYLRKEILSQLELLYTSTAILVFVSEKKYILRDIFCSLNRFYWVFKKNQDFSADFKNINMS
jgi:hypothetical protein